jgi:hypothetical protein
MKTKSKSYFRQFLTAYIECALWASCDNSTESGGEPFDANYSLDDIAFSSLLSMARECRDFMRGNEADLDAYCEKCFYSSSHPALAMAGHDFWLTKNGHGAGFWDRGLGDLGKRLSDASKAYGSTDLYLGDDGKIYAS